MELEEQRTNLKLQTKEIEANIARHLAVADPNHYSLLKLNDQSYNVLELLMVAQKNCESLILSDHAVSRACREFPWFRKIRALECL